MLQSLSNRMTSLSFSTAAGAVLASLANWTSTTILADPNETMFGRDYYSGSVIGGLVAFSCALVSIESGSAVRLRHSVVCAVLWALSAHALNVMLGWTSHGLNLTSIICGINFGAVIGVLCSLAGTGHDRPALRSLVPTVHLYSFAGTYAFNWAAAIVLLGRLLYSPLFGSLEVAVFWCVVFSLGYAYTATPKNTTIIGSTFAGAIGMLYLYGMGLLIVPDQHLSLLSAAAAGILGAIVGYGAFFIGESAKLSLTSE